ncbi:ABC transporter substrate-binding protein [Natrarchaeobius sp. A-rgal3]|uniref:ABC transporter substrate-binding protein n=1 Tax=Natrarchaeobius versutus TaxID=1679078 RepID=UPI00350FA03A
MGQTRYTRRNLLAAGVGSVATGAVLAGCTDTTDGTIETESDVDDPLRIATDSDPDSPLNIYISSHSEFDWLKDLVFDRLLAPSPYVEEPMAGLATETERIDGRTWTATVRSDAEWHDGEPFTAEDVVFTYRYYRDGPQNRHSHHVNEIPDIERIESIDEETVRFECSYPTPTLADITFADLPILSKHVWEDVDDPYEHTELPVGTGPYELVSYEPGERLRLRANENYFMGEPTVEEIVVPFIRDHSTMFTALRSGEIDTTSVGIPPSSIEDFRQDEAFDVVSATTLWLVEIRVNYERPPFDRPAVRRAVSRAIDKQSIVDVVMLGNGIPGTEGYPHPDSPWTAPDIEQPYDPDQSRALLEELEIRDRDGDGVRETPDGEPLSFRLEVPSNEPAYIRAAELVTENLTDVGLETESRTLDPGAIGDLHGSRNFDMYVSRITPHGVADPDQFVMSHRSGYLWNSEIPYPEWDELVEEFKQAEGVDGVRPVLFEMQRLFNEQPTSIPLWYEKPRFAFDPDAFDSWAESPGFGIHHKWSFLPEDARESAITESF